MSYSPVEHVESLRIGVVDFVSPDEIKVLLDIEAPDSVALNAGGARPFPRVNGYVLIPVDAQLLVGQIEWVTVERSAFPKRRGVQDFGIVDLPYPLRKMKLNPLGTLVQKFGGDEVYSFKRGADALPSIGTPVHLPTDRQLRSIVESGERRWIKLGTSPLAGDAEVSVNPDKLFGRHLAVLGNTGSGKSCSVAGIIRWSLEAAKAQCDNDKNPNARCIILDPNGEYARAFSSEGKPDLEAKIFSVSPEPEELPLQVPLWFWNSAEWASFTHATEKTQKPLLKRALREIKAGRLFDKNASEEEKKLNLRRYLSSTLVTIQRDLRFGYIKTEETKFGFRLDAVKDDVDKFSVELKEYKLQEIVTAIQDVLGDTHQEFEKDGKKIEYYRAFKNEQVEKVIETLKASLSTLGGIVYQEGPDEDVPLAFKGAEFADHLQILSTQENHGQFLDYFISRIRTFLSDTRIRSVVGDHENMTLEKWLEDYIGAQEAKESITIIDLSLVPSEIIHIVTAVSARMIFEALQRYRKINKVVLPTVLVMEEAHTFIKRYKDDIENHDSATICCQVFEKIAREGRKFGLGLVLSSQRPSELSQTVLSQCNTFLLHRISNDRDQELVNRLVPDNLRGLLRELPSLPSQHAILLGWASDLPVLVKMRNLPKEQQPHSADPDFWNVWTGKDEIGRLVERKADWNPIAEDWRGVANRDTKSILSPSTSNLGKSKN